MINPRINRIVRKQSSPGCCYLFPFKSPVPCINFLARLLQFFSLLNLKSLPLTKQGFTVKRGSVKPPVESKIPKHREPWTDRSVSLALSRVRILYTMVQMDGRLIRACSMHLYPTEINASHYSERCNCGPSVSPSLNCRN